MKNVFMSKTRLSVIFFLTAWFISPGCAEQDRGTGVKDPYYPKYHVAPSGGWMNDPHPVYFKGQYHIFYQFSCIPDDPYGGPHSWGHVASADLIHWKHYPTALTPKDHGITKGKVDPPHVWSGCVVDNNGVGTAIYTIDNIDVWIATSPDKDLATFKKYAGNPVIKGPPPGLSMDTMHGMRDPWVWKEGNTWYLIIGSALAGGKGPVIPLYKSYDLIHWEYLHPLYQGEGSKFDFLGDAYFCDCPSFFSIGDKYILALSDKAIYLVGAYKNQCFIPERRDRLDYGETQIAKDGGIYVPQIILDAKGRHIMWGWVGGCGKVERDRQLNTQTGWAGMQTIPRVLTLGSDGLLNYAPAEELQLLRSDHREFSDIQLANNKSMFLDGVQGMQLEVHITFEPGKSTVFGLEFLDTLETAKIFYDVPTKTIHFNNTAVPLELKRFDKLYLQIFVDGKVIELFANKKIVLTEDIQPVSPDGIRIKLFADDQTTARKVDVWKMGTIW
jgi:beta-fructofuranosidase